MQFRKLLRYVLIYGFRRTLAKVEGGMHMRGRESLLSYSRRKQREQKVAIVGCGNYAFSTIGYFLVREFGAVIGGCLDTCADRAASFGKKYAVPCWTTEADELFGIKSLELVYICSNHSTHAEYAIQALHRNLSVYIEKPPVVSIGQLHELVEAAKRSKGNVFLGFNRPNSPFMLSLIPEIRAQRGPGTYNWFVVGHKLPADHWYYDGDEGGRVLGNMCHWIDSYVSIVGDELLPVIITPSRGSEVDRNVSVSYTFGEGSIGTVTFACRGEIVDGVREYFWGQVGNIMVSIENFDRMVIEEGFERRVSKSWPRDQGHRRSICAPYEALVGGNTVDKQATIRRLVLSGLLMLKTSESLVDGEARTVSREEVERWTM
jgi:predicted dehydrogenase